MGSTPRALGQFASPYFVASEPASPQRTPTYASGCRLARASSGSQLAPVPALKSSYRAGAQVFAELLGRVAATVHAGGESTVVACFALAVLVRAAVGRAAYPTSRRADGRARAGRACRSADRGAERRATESADSRADADTLGGVGGRIPARLLLGPHLALVRVARLLLGGLSLGRISEDRGLRIARRRAAAQHRRESHRRDSCHEALRNHHGRSSCPAIMTGGPGKPEAFWCRFMTPCRSHARRPRGTGPRRPPSWPGSSSRGHAATGRRLRSEDP